MMEPSGGSSSSTGTGTTTGSGSTGTTTTTTSDGGGSGKGGSSSGGGGFTSGPIGECLHAKCIKHDGRDYDHVKVIRKTVVVHDKVTGTPQTIIVNTNPTTGTYFVTQTQITKSKDLLATLLQQCVSITILRG